MLSENTANIWMASDAGQRGGWASTAAALLVGALLGTAITAVAERQIWHAAESAQPPAVVQSWPDRPLPREWRWSPPSVKVDHMFPKLR